VSVPDLHLSSLVYERPRRGLLRLRFSGFVEEHFRQHYGRMKYGVVRPLIVLGTAAMILATLVGIYQRDVSVMTATYGLAVVLPLLMATLIASYRPGHQNVYQTLLVVSVLGVGLIVNSLTLRASMHGTPYHFGGLVAWIFTVWLVLGLLFWYAAAAALTLSAAYVWGLFHWNFGQHELLYECVMLAGANLIGALCCFQHEASLREAFSKQSKLEDQAHRDGLTGLHNRRVYDEYMERIWRQSQREQAQLAIMLIDIDYFKPYNDLYGHQAGDEALRRVAEVIEHGAQRPLDFAARYGGEEFALVLYGASHDVASELAEQLRQKVLALAIPHARSAIADRLTVSVGVAIITPGAARSLAGAIQMADEALYQAKEEGRNRILIKESRLTEIETGRFRAGRRAAAG
jgi:diguanylate cyclase (GGDEF)-like protein